MEALIKRGYWNWSDLEGIIPGIYPFTGCDTVSVFLDKGKLKVFNLMLKDGIFIQLFQSLGTSWGLADESYILAEPFLWALCCKMYCSKRGKCVINYHLVDYCYKNIFKELTTKLKYGNFPSILYKIYQILQLEGGLLKIDWMDCKPALWGTKYPAILA